MKRNIIKILFSVILLGACSKSFLERNPLDEISSGDYWRKISDLELYANQFYPSLTGRGMFGLTYWGEGVIGLTRDNNSDYDIKEQPNDRLRGIRTVPGSGGGWNWSNIRSVNYFLIHYNSVEAAWDNVRQYVGEVYFFKAYYYFDLLRSFGDVPWLSKPLATDSEELYMARTPRSVVVDSIVANLDKAIAFMKSKDSAPSFRLNSEVALLFKSRVCLFEGTWEKYHAGTPFGVTGSDGSKFINLAANAAKELIDRGLYDIFSEGNPHRDYASLFAQEDYSNNPEVLFWQLYDFDLGMYHGIPGMGANDDGLTKWLIDSYLCTDGLPISLSPLYVGDNNVTDVATNRDPRLAQTIWIPGDPLRIIGKDTTLFTKPDIDRSGEKMNTTGYQVKKGFYLVSYLPGEMQTEMSETGDIIFRYAEALLNYAEAKAELGTISQSDIDMTINKLRDRVGLQHLNLGNISVDPDWPYPNLSPIINEIRRERGVELAVEGFRLDDFLRWRSHSLILNKLPKGAKFIQSDFPQMIPGENIFIDNEGYISRYQNSLPLGYQFNPNRDYLDPIPSLELTINKKLVQNPGWE